MCNLWTVTLQKLFDIIILSGKLKHDNDNSKTKHATQNLKHQKAVALRAQWLEDNVLIASRLFGGPICRTCGKGASRKRMSYRGHPFKTGKGNFAEKASEGSN